MGHYFFFFFCKQRTAAACSGKISHPLVTLYTTHVSPPESNRRQKPHIPMKNKPEFLSLTGYYDYLQDLNTLEKKNSSFTNSTLDEPLNLK